MNSDLYNQLRRKRYYDINRVTVNPTFCCLAVFLGVTKFYMISTEHKSIGTS